ncbi:hypothetical protein K491DRAFT_584512 [Lophiostoma macrostomum CBS 122681]|uniref:C2H2-type domain-containing protein n=1 Tax=Lophiostoma macrostomum CBS 122681 TaxID=1314788 RepID=A0A6A6TV71_9PLEO|nr:hypothetical protein K491DRAFT_584512 [Lophiostoma macrostomum CBS 122681]
MSSPSSHPRRRPLKGGHSPVPSLKTHGMQLRKSGTFTSPQTLSSDVCDLENFQYMPRRSPTSTESLEELLHDAGVQRVANILKDFDKKIAGHKSSSATSVLNDREVLPLPSFILDNTRMDSTPMDVDPKPAVVERNPHDHASDSGLGSSVSGSKHGDRQASVRESISTSITTTHSAITRSCSGLGAAEDKHMLGEYACKAIHDNIIKPILREDALKDFHPLIKDVPRRIGEKNISNLRDLEKTLIFLAPVSGIRYLSDSSKAHCIFRGFKEFSATPTSYLRFCERSIQLLAATVNCLSEQDQRLPTDRPYTTNYFLDLVEQIRRYAAIMAATRQKESNGEELDEMDYSPDEKITIRGGLSHNGRPAELVREKNGKVIPIAEGVEDAYSGLASSKRALSDDEMDDDEVKRSMARRRKSEKPGDVLHACRDCKKEFKRPCDLTKHEKTHSRPWKCSEEKCKYFDLGWPTEKERDRHVNDKHSAAPPQYKCLYPPCTYASKRESNCKQHMEKAHGWEYVRSKSNGRKKAPTSGSDRSPPTPLTPWNLGTPTSAFPTPQTPFMSSPSVPLMDFGDYNMGQSYGFNTPALSAQGFQDEFRRDSVTTDGSTYTFSSGQSPTEPTSFENAVSPEETSINHNDIFNNAMCNNFTNAFQQQPTPALSTGFDTFEGLAFQMNNTLSTNIPHLSPGAQPDVTLFSPQMPVDEGFNEVMPAFGDFTLFDTTQPNSVNLNATADFFPELNNFGGQFDNPYADAMPNTFGDDLMDHTFGNL